MAMMILVPFVVFLASALVIVGARGGGGGAARNVDDRNLLASYMSFSGRSQLTAVPSSNTVLWVEQVAGVANVYAASTTSTTEGESVAAVTFYEKDDGEEITIIGVHLPRHSPPVVHFFRGPSDDANPTHAVVPPSGAIVAAEIPSFSRRSVAKSPQILFNGSALCLDGTHGIVYASRSPTTGYAQMKRAAIADSGMSIVGPHELLFETKHGSLTGAVWSPSATNPALAFSNDRGDHGFVGLWTPGSESLTWVSPSYDKDDSPFFNADGTILGFRRVRDVTDSVTGWDSRCKAYGYCAIVGPAFSIHVVSIYQREGQLQLGNTQNVYQDFKHGYPDQGFGTRPIQFAPGVEENVILFGTETSGFVQVGSVTLADESFVPKSKMLTPATCDNQAWYAAPGGKLYVVHNCDRDDSLGVAVVDISSGKRQRVIQAAANAYGGISGSGSGLVVVGEHIVTLQCDAIGCKIYSRLGVDGMDRALTPHYGTASFEAASRNFVKPRSVNITSIDKAFTLHLQVFDPPGSTASSKRPAVIFTHGGCMRQMYSAMHYDYDYASLYVQNEYLATVLNMTVISANYRGGVGRGISFRSCKRCNWQGGAEYGDVLAAGLYARTIPGVDASRIGIYGLSYGGINTLQALSRNSDVFAAGVANAPVYNWVSEFRSNAAKETPFDVISYRSGDWADFRALKIGPGADIAGPDWNSQAIANMRLAFDSSPAGHVFNLTSPLLVIQGDSDANVDFQETVGLVRALRTAQRNLGLSPENLETLVFPDERHGLAVFANEVTAAAATVDFFANRL